MIEKRSVIAGGGAAVAAVFLALLLNPVGASATAPATPRITEPSADGQLVHPADVHMEAVGFTDADGDAHACSDWQILAGGATGPVVWQANCATGVLAVHIHLGDGQFVGPYQGRTELEFGHEYVLQVRFRDSAGEVSDWARRPFGTYPPASPGGAVAWTPVQPGYQIQTVATGLQLPVDIAFVPKPGRGPKAPLLYVTELYGAIEVIDRDGTVHDYATGLLNYNPTGNFPGSGEQGLAGIVVDPATGDVFASAVYDADGSDATTNDHYPEVLRFHSVDGGHTAATMRPIIRMPGEVESPSHQISNLTIGPDRKLYVHLGDGFDPATARDLNSFRGKVLRMNLDGSAPTDNPFYDSSDGATQPRDYIYAYGFRNPFGGAWRAANHAQYEVENGPAVDRLARIFRGRGYGYDGTDESMATRALYNWAPSHAPVNIDFVQRATFLGSGFPRAQMDHAFVTESGPTFATGPQALGKRIVEFDPQPSGEIGGHPNGVVEYTGSGKATAVGLAAGPDGLYWTELYDDHGTSAVAPGARLLRVRYVGTSRVCRLHGRTLIVRSSGGRALVARRANGQIEVNGKECGATVLDLNGIRVKGRGKPESLTLDTRRGRLAPGYLRPPGAGIRLVANLGSGPGDVLVVRAGARRDRLDPTRHGIALGPKQHAAIRNVERFRLEGGRGSDRLAGGRHGDVIQGGPGRDRIDVRGGGRDRVACGGGRDVVEADRRDAVATSCEVVRR